MSSAASAQTIVLKTEQRIESQGVRRDGDMILAKVQVGTGSGEVGYHLPQIARVEFPEPAALKAAAELNAQGDAARALATIEPVVSYYLPYRDVPGAWWAQAALIKLSALSALQRDADTEKLANDLQKFVTDPETTRTVQVKLTANLIKKREFDKAIAICDAAIKDSTDSATVATAWVAKGDALLAKKEWDSALMSYLHVPVFFPDETNHLPAALLGSARAYRRLDDVDRAKKSLNELIAQFPKTAEANVAKTELQKLQK